MRSTNSSPRALVGLLASAALVGACDWRVFDDLVEETWVRSTSAPENLSSDDFGFGAACGGSESGELSFVVASRAPAKLTKVTFDSSAQRTTKTLAVRDTITFAESLEAPVALAGDEDSYGAENGNMALGVYDGEDAYLYMFRADTFIATAPLNLGELGAAPSHVAFGASAAGDAEARDVCATIGTNIACVSDYQSANENDVFVCDAEETATGIVLGDLDASAAGDEVIVSVGGTLYVLSAQQITGDENFTPVQCFSGDNPQQALATIDAPGGEDDFGAQLKVGDFDDSGELDLVVTAPGTSKAWIYYDWSVGAPSEATRVDKPSGAIAFGSELAVGDVDSDGVDDLVIADPRRATGTKQDIGTAYLYRGGPSSLPAPIALFDAKSEDKQSFGQAMAICDYGDDGILNVGANEETFTYFRTPIEGDDDAR